MEVRIHAERQRTMTAEIEWPRPPVEGYTADDLDRLPNLPAHTELIDGSLVFISPRQRFHTKTLLTIENSLLRTVPPWADVVREMTIKIARRQRPEPDLVVLRTDLVAEDDTVTWYPAAAVVLAVEVVSPESEIRDRKRKPSLYAEAGIQHFWIVDRDPDGRTVVETFTLDKDRYVPVGTYTDRLVVDAPFAIDIDFTRPR